MQQAKQKRELKITTNSDLDIQIESIVNVPREYVFLAHTDPKAIPHWWGPAKYTTTVMEMDVRPGGRWRFVQKDSEGNEYVFFGEFKEIVPLDKIIWTFNYEPFPNSECLETVQFIALDGNRTKILVNSIYSSKEARDGMLSSGMEAGYSASLDRLEKMEFPL
ncbi:MAG: SRPBCC family protein [Candidatus Thorarchaeota archaeon]